MSDEEYCEDDDHVFVSRRLFHQLFALWAIVVMLLFVFFTGLAIAHNLKELYRKPAPKVTCVSAAPKVTVTVLPKTLPITN